MSWKIDIVETLRVLINDLSDIQTYADSRLERIILVAANQVLMEVDFDTLYTVNISEAEITPDPTDITIKDSSFVALTALKAASLVARGEMKLGAASAGFIVKDGPSSVDTSNYYQSLSGAYKQFILDYEFLKMNYKVIKAGASAQAITTPTTVLQIYGNLEVLGY